MSAANILNSPITGAPAITTPYASGGGGGAGVASINGATGAITVAAGAGIGVATVGTTVTITNTGGGPGLFLPLAGGTMDAFPAGVITAHTINEIASLTGIGATAPGNTFVIQTDAVGDNILIDASPSSGAVDINGFAATITTQTNVEIEGRVVIQPPVGYTYPLVPQLGGLHIKNWNNTNATPGNVMIACEIDTISSIEDAVGLGGGGITSSTTSASGINLSTISGPNTATGAILTNISSANQATGVNIQSITGTSQAYGLQMNTVNSTGASFGVDIQNITGDGQVVGIQASSISTTAGQSYGMVLNSMVGPGGAIGIELSGVDAQVSPGSGAQATGIQVSGVNGDSQAYGILVGGVDASFTVGNGAPATGIQIGGVTADGQTTGMVMNKILGKNADRVRGIEMFDIRGDDVNAIGGNDVVGIEIRELEDSIGSGNATGITVSKVTNALQSSESKGISIDNIINRVATGLEVASIVGIVNIPFGPDGARGVDIDSVTTDTGECYGLKIDTVSAGDGISGPGRAFGISVDNITGTSRCFGIRVGPTMTAPAGTPKVAFKQTGGSGIINEFDNRIDCGGAEDANTGQSLRINGNAFYKAQYITGGGSIQANGGNLIVLAGGGGYLLSLPSVNVKEGHQYTLCMTAIANITLDAGGVLVNGGATYVLPGITAPDNKMWQAFYTTGSGVGQWYVG